MKTVVATSWVRRQHTPRVVFRRGVRVTSMGLGAWALVVAACSGNSNGDASGMDATPGDVVAGDGNMHDAPMRDGTLDVGQDTGSDSGPVDAAVIPPGMPGASDVQFTVDVTRNVAPISRYIYGFNSPDWARAQGITMTRMGGNRMTAYNWVNNASNAGTDYMNENDNYLCSDAGCDQPGEAVRRAIADAHSHNAGIVITVPIQGYVAADESPGGDVNMTANYLTTRFRPSVAHKGSAFTLTPSASTPTVYQDEFVNWVDHTFPTAHSDPVQSIFYDLDNEPDLWHSTHPRIELNPVTYAELITKTTDFATAIKSVQPDAVVFGPVSYGWQGYITLQNAPDAGGRDFLDFYLDSMRSAESTAGHRLVDVLDLHWYPEASGNGVRIIDDDASAPVAAARVQAPRSLWDPTYTETSWITMYSTMGPIRLIPRMRDKIAMHYPGTRLSLTEYNYGGGGDISGGIAEADVLGIFGREGMYAAAVWPLGSTGEPYVYGGIAMFRNYDGAGATFGDTSIHGDTSDVPRSSVYASVDAGHPERMVLVAINKTGGALNAGITVTSTVRYNHAAVYTLTSASSTPRHGTDVTISAVNAFVYAMPANSVSTLVLTP